MEYPNSPRLMCQFASGEQHFLVCMGYKTIRIDVSDGFQNLIIEILLHFCDVSHSFFCETLELRNIHISSIHSQRGILGRMDFLEQIAVMFGSRGGLYYHGYANMLLHDGMHFHTAFAHSYHCYLANTKVTTRAEYHARYSVLISLTHKSFTGQQ